MKSPFVVPSAYSPTSRCVHLEESMLQQWSLGSKIWVSFVHSIESFVFYTFYTINLYYNPISSTHTSWKMPEGGNFTILFMRGFASPAHNQHHTSPSPHIWKSSMAFWVFLKKKRVLNSSQRRPARYNSTRQQMLMGEEQWRWFSNDESSWFGHRKGKCCQFPLSGCLLCSASFFQLRDYQGRVSTPEHSIRLAHPNSELSVLTTSF